MVDSTIETQGGAVVQGEVSTGGGDFVGRDKITYDNSHSTLFDQRYQWVQAQYNIVLDFERGAKAEDIIEVLRSVGILQRLTTRLPQEQFSQLLTIIEPIRLDDSDEWFRLYRATLPSGGHLVNSTMPSLILADLCEQPTSKGWPPILEFVERLALSKGLKDTTISDLQDWVDASAGLVTPLVIKSEIERLRQQVRAEQKKMAAPSYLQIYLEPDWLNRTQERKQPLYKVELVLWSPLTNGPFVLQSEGDTHKELWTLEELPTLLDKALANREYVSLIPDIMQLLIEVVAPSDLLYFGFERWKRNNPPLSYGVQYPLVVRLKDRLTIAHAADQEKANYYWRQKWDEFDRNLCYEQCEKLSWLSQEALEDYPNTIIDLQDPNISCVGLSVPLAPDKREVFDLLRDSGIPIAIWLRASELDLGEIKDLPQHISALIQGKPLADLRKTVYETRRSKEVRSNKNHIGNALTLLWDDPNRPPLKYEAQGVFS